MFNASAVDLWDVTDPTHLTQRFRYLGHEREVTSVGFAPNGNTLITGSSDSTARMWDMPPPALRRAVHATLRIDPKLSRLETLQFWKAWLLSAS